MARYRFEQIAFNSTEKKKPEEHDRFTYLGLEHLDSGCLKVSRFGAEVAPVGDKLVMRKGDVLFGKRRAYQKKVAIAPFDGIFSAHGMVLRPRENVIDAQFFPFFISSDYFLDAAIKISVGSLSPTINWRDLKNLEFDLPSLEEQRKLAAVLQSITETIESYKTLLDKTDELVKSQFIELFGDPSVNPFGWKKIPLKNLMTCKISNGFFAKQKDYSDDGNIGVVCVGDVVNRKFSKVFDLRRAYANETEIKKYCVKYGDLLFCRSSLVKEGIGKASIVPKDTPHDVVFECHVIRVSLDIQRCIPEFIQEQTTTDYFRNLMLASSKTATITTIGQDAIEKAEVILPPIERQKHFVAFAQQLDKSKFTIQYLLHII